ncbi:uncharacterized protein LOC127751001 isoform X2 [Frankliniella occidentalis]|uniref:Uncharacterized protein LOC127751001 isoform X2 n=1 Tax=Frankliniella occidentalis TaxID=133901 RepID=A0A9C6X639_FRAOC|nr:uncharacterized protein LOC127751001 isoform X2 [Frankliniella occidentalis]
MATTFLTQKVHQLPPVPTLQKKTNKQHVPAGEFQPSGNESVGKLMFRMQTSIESVTRKVDTILLNQARLVRKFLPHEKRIERPEGLPLGRFILEGQVFDHVGTHLK